MVDINNESRTRVFFGATDDHVYLNSLMQCTLVDGSRTVVY